jgi:acyl-CoA thioester hydrolase
MKHEKVFPELCDGIEIKKDMCDYNGHMNVLFYFKIFIDTLETYYENELGFSKEYFSKGFSSFSLEDNIRYLKECKINQVVSTRFRLHSINKKLIHLVSIMINESNEVCSIYETVIAHIDMTKRKTVNMEGRFFENIKIICERHNETEINLPLKLSIKPVS